MKIFFTLGLLLSTLSATLAQLADLRQADSLKLRLSIAIQDTDKVLILAELSEAYRYSLPDTALSYARNSLSLARQTKFPKGEINALLSISVVMRELGNFPKALETALLALQMAKANHIIHEEELSLIRVANVYVASKNFSTALNYYKQAEKKLAFVPDDFYSAVAQVWSGIAYEELNMLDSALYYEQLASGKIFRYATLPPLYFRVLGNIEAKSGNNKLALDYYQQGIQAALKFNNYRDVAPLFISVASFYRKNNQSDSAIYYAKQGLAYGQLLAYKNRIMDASSLLAELYEGKDIKESLRYHKMSAAAKDSMYSAEKVQALQTITFDEQERQREINVAKTEYRNQIRQYVLIAGLGIFLIIALLLYRNNRYKQKANVILRQQKQEIQDALTELKSTQSQLVQREKMASLGELTAGIAHEIQNPLNFINNFSEVNDELVDELRSELAVGNMQSAAEIAGSIKENGQKINNHGKRADAIVKGMLQHSRTSTGQKELTDINALCDEYLRLAYHGLRAKDKNFNAEIKTEFDNSIGKINVVAQDIGRVLLNLINNAFYAVNEKATSSKLLAISYEARVFISTKRNENKIEIKIRDTGNGIPQKILDKIFQPFFTTKPTGKGTGLGLSLAYDIVKAHGGEIKVETKEGEGTEFIIQLPASPGIP